MKKGVASSATPNIIEPFSMAKYSPEFKQQIVYQYLEGILGYLSLTNKYAISSKSQIETWVRQYKQKGKNGLQAKEKQEYTGGV